MICQSNVDYSKYVVLYVVDYSLYYIDCRLLVLYVVDCSGYALLVSYPTQSPVLLSGPD